ncbi:hypothetical protein AYO40_00285 [Planctomycetaceae bacterium SCGC AG-212-D15]|nr:hypothetical protein AYO40_00285 [Planctomycetaceae bacterium SCGC AG-212-D15]
MDLGIDYRLSSIEPLCQGLQNAFYELVVVGGEMDAVQEVVAVAAVRKDGIGPALFIQAFPDVFNNLANPILLFIGSRLIGPVSAVHINKQPSATKDVGIACRLPGHFDFVRFA